MKQKIKTEKVLSAYKVLSTAKYGKLDDEDKVNVWKIARVLKPIADKFDDDVKDATDKMMPYENYSEDIQKAQEYEQNEGVGCDMTKEEYRKFILSFKSYNELVGKAVKEFAEKEVELEFNGLSENAFGKLMSSNEWTVEQAMEIGFMIVE